MLSDFKVFMRDLFLDLMDRVFLENIFVSSVIIFELFNINKHFILAWLVTLIFALLKIKRKKLLDTIFTYNLYKYRRFKNFRLFGTLNVTLIIMYIIFYSLIKSDIVLLNVLLFMILRAVIIVEVQFAQNALSIELIESILYGYEFEIPSPFENEYLDKITVLMEDFKVRDRLRLEENFRSERFKVDLITNISHDLKTPLTSIINYADLLSKKEVLDDEAKNFVAILKRNSTRLKDLIVDLVFASKTSTGNLSIEKSLVELNEMILQIYGDYDSLFEKRDLEFSYKSASDEILIYTDVNLFVRIVENLFSNAAKHARPGTRVLAGVIERESTIEFYVKNIVDEKLNMNSDELFEELLKADRSRHSEGSGLGLNIVKNLAELLGGEVKVSIHGQWFEVHVLLLRDSD
ncbi:MAG: HAMP domain-containing sensor histidine kinase [Peptoniphilus harei]|uniref:histidine kinase n=1 Tax=Peptoniphilus harei ACS-146-V-Sch2b TaxID=908338 RepID=E4L0M7_9FIRM|nr:HAMP domain-containing sensor histidine kinase [Peptoniphilus harei]EFR32345.1 histidine kinase A domain protein [Peptoniphilus harei ACS-146-V-Sch2b]MDK7754921.1 HAMP domain-containing sensor histidine kinase [Peptoniphilus harei]MDK7760727.1 HAMP domain-containing sensor histidine kinase [Peptoniphilus harei]MDK8270518.1 HAMP domain-containing sensor histidine kinase [Peptoniphilus harei]MDK8340023.1 HAMP domain-containing sensor histidine kinase [Peptoniphilus harei]